MNPTPSIRLKLPVTVLLERRLISRSFWSVPSWYLYSVAVGEHVAAAESACGAAQAAGRTERGELFAWSHCQVKLYKDACERYWHALIGDSPLIYVVCRETGEQGASAIRPIIVTIDYDEATACAETDELVLSAAIPPELYRYMEAFVLEHYKPKPFTKRKRRQWSENEPRDRGAS